MSGQTQVQSTFPWIVLGWINQNLHLQLCYKGITGCASGSKVNILKSKFACTFAYELGEQPFRSHTPSHLFLETWVLIVSKLWVKGSLAPHHRFPHLTGHTVGANRWSSSWRG